MPTQQIGTVVMDEADQLMGESFHEDVEAILAELPATKQVLCIPPHAASCNSLCSDG